MGPPIPMLHSKGLHGNSQCVQYGTGRPSSPKVGDKTAAASFTEIMPNRLAASSVFRPYHSGGELVLDR